MKILKSLCGLFGHEWAFVAWTGTNREARWECVCCGKVQKN